ncbi:MAG: electron transfer flavoprotein subunit beta/FixA family protein [Thermoanaerobacterales bacterium]|jgi:electron transfer flavoprotein beta subunit|nr:electron transfer flavoprotein subunit beta/FixA family protein [Thermoanaerobacterales bacterium]
MALNIAVCIKPVPDPDYYDKIQIHPEKKTLIRKGIPTILNPMDKNAIEEALKIKEQYGGKVSLFSMAPPDAVGTLKEGLAMGADEAYLLSDIDFAGADTLATSYTLSLGIKKAGQYDLVLLGNESADGATSQVPSQLGEWLQIPHLMNIQKLCIVNEENAVADMKTETGYIKYKVRLPALIAVRREINTPRYISFKNILRAKNKKITTWGVADINPDLDKIGLKGSPTQAGKIYIPDISRKGEEITGTSEEIAEKLIRHLRAVGLNIADGGQAL